MRVAINQSNYLPWKGYFDLIHEVDLFVFYDDVQYTTRDWRNRNVIKTPQGNKWLTVPVGADRNRLISEVAITDRDWPAVHWRRLLQAYGKAPHFGPYKAFFQEIYLGRTWDSLSQLNQFLIKHIAREFLGIATKFTDSGPLKLTSRKQDRIFDVLAAVGADVYVSGPAAKAYLEPARFAASGITLEWKDYAGYPGYGQFFPPFEHAVTILDLLFHVGSEAPDYIWEWRTQAGARSLNARRA